MACDQSGIGISRKCGCWPPLRTTENSGVFPFFHPFFVTISNHNFNRGFENVLYASFTDQKPVKACAMYPTTTRSFACFQLNPNVNFTAEKHNGV